MIRIKYGDIGFTLVELLVALFVIALVASILWGGLSGYRNNQALSTGVETVLAALAEARTKTVSSEGDRQYGVYFDAGRAVIFPGPTYAEGGVLNREFRLENAISISTTSLLVSTSTIMFAKITGGAANYGTITIALKSDSTKTKIIAVSQTGEVSQQ